MAAHIEQRGFGLFAQGIQVYARRHCKQDVPHIDTFTCGVRGLVGRVVTPTSFLGRFWHYHFLLQQHLNRLGCDFAEYPISDRGVGGSKQSFLNGRLTQQL